MGGKAAGVASAVVNNPGNFTNNKFTDPLGLQNKGIALLAGKQGNQGPDPVGLEEERLKGLLNEENMQYLSDEEKKKYQGLLGTRGNVAPQDQLGYFKSNADSLESLVSTRREKATLFKEQTKLLANLPGAKQFKNTENPLILAAKDTLTTESLTASGASKNGTALTT